MPSLPIPQQLSALLASIKAKVTDGLTIPEALALIQEAIAAFMAAVAVLNEPGTEKKALVLAYLSDLIDFLLAKLISLMPFYARWVAPYFAPILKQAILAFANEWLERNYLQNFKPTV